MWRLLYNILLLLVSPLVVAVLLAKQRCRRGFPARMGFRVRPVADPSGGRRPLIWIHAVSLGEVVAVTPFVKELHRLHPDHRLLVSTVTETGREAVEQRLAGIAEHRYAPLDFPWAVARAIDCWQPALYVFVETELWPNLLWRLRDRGIPAVLMNGRLSSRSFARQHVTGLTSFYRSVLRSLTLCLMQSERDVQRIVALGADPSRVKRTGNIKFDQPMPAAPADASFRASLGVGAQDRLVLAGSTHAGEEALIVEAYRHIVLQHPSALLMLAPRHIERSEEVVAMVTAAGLPVQRKSRLDAVGSGPRVILLDTRGELARAYHEAAAAFVRWFPWAGIICWSRPAGESLFCSVPIRTTVRRLRRSFWNPAERCGWSMPRILRGRSAHGWMIRRPVVGSGRPRGEPSWTIRARCNGVWS